MLSDSGGDEFDVDVLVAVHTPTRPVERAVRSALGAGPSRARVIVVVHNTALEPVRARLGELANDPRVVLIPLIDGISSPSGPFNAALDAATAPWFALLGSDDELEAGALDAWRLRAERDCSDGVLARIVLSDGRTDPYPPTRPGRLSGLDVVRDRLAYRSAPLGLWSRKRFGEFRFPIGVASGEDLPFSLAIWVSGASLSYALDAPGYRIHADAGDRVTSAPRPLVDDFAFLDHLRHASWFASVGPKEREAIVVKLLRMHVPDALRARIDSPDLGGSSLPQLAAVLDTLRELAPEAESLVSRADERLLRAVRAGEVEQLPRLLSARSNYRRPSSLLPAAIGRTFDPQGPLRTLLAGALAARVGART